LLIADGLRHTLAVMWRIQQQLLLLASIWLAYSIRPSSARRLASRQQGNDNTSSLSSVQPISINPSQSWLGLDGNWSTFAVQVGTPAQTSNLLVSFNLYQIWVVLTEGCTGAASLSSCATSRGGLFDVSASSSWNTIGIYEFAIEQNLGYSGNSRFGYDYVRLPGAQTALPAVNSTIGGFAVDDFHLGLLGLNPRSTNFSTDGSGSPSYMGSLRQQNLIPSTSFGYTAGASYRSNGGAPASLTLGGFDKSRFVSNGNTFNLNSDPERDTVIALQQISTPSQIVSSPSGTALLPSPIFAFLDSSIAEIWLPIEACRAFEFEFGLTYDASSQLYLVSDSQHQTLQSRNASITFTLGQALSTGSTVSITLPYAAFDLTATAPYRGLSTSSFYFPLRRAQNSTQYTLGRTFFQEAYISVDYEAGTFNLSQAAYSPSTSKDVVTIPPSYGSSNTGSSSSANNGNGGLSGGAIAGIVVGSIAALVILALFLIWFFRLRRKPSHSTFVTEKDNFSYIRGAEDRPYVIPKAELEGSMPTTERAISPALPTGIATMSAFHPKSIARTTDSQLISTNGSTSGDGDGAPPVSPRSPLGRGGLVGGAFTGPAIRGRNDLDSLVYGHDGGAQHPAPSSNSESGPSRATTSQEAERSANPYTSANAAAAFPTLTTTISPTSSFSSHFRPSTAPAHSTRSQPSMDRIAVHEMPGDMPGGDSESASRTTSPRPSTSIRPRPSTSSSLYSRGFERAPSHDPLPPGAAALAAAFAAGRIPGGEMPFARRPSGEVLSGTAQPGLPSGGPIVTSPPSSGSAIDSRTKPTPTNNNNNNSGSGSSGSNSKFFRNSFSRLRGSSSRPSNPPPPRSLPSPPSQQQQQRSPISPPTRFPTSGSPPTISLPPLPLAHSPTSTQLPQPTTTTHNRTPSTASGLNTARTSQHSYYAGVGVDDYTGALASHPPDSSEASPSTVAGAQGQGRPSSEIVRPAHAQLLHEVFEFEDGDGDGGVRGSGAGAGYGDVSDEEGTGR
jgi:hypothetical protein